jgi:hypothetical protein
MRRRFAIFLQSRLSRESGCGRFCCKKILRIGASNIDSKSGANAQLIQNPFVQIRLLRTYPCKLLLADSCNQIGTKRT